MLIFIFVLVGGYICFYESRGAKKEQENLKVERIFDVRSGDVREILIIRGEQTVLLKKESDQWRIEKPFQGIVDERKLSDLLSVFDYGIIRVVDPNPSDYDQYGLEPPQIEFAIKVGENPIIQSLLIGRRNTANISCYARIRGQRGVLLIGGAYEIVLTRTLNHFFRSK